jgi:signal transduction histidine kinase
MNFKISPQVDPSSRVWGQAQLILEALPDLSYRTGELEIYLQHITNSISRLMGIDWSAVTLCWDDTEKVLASNLDLGEGEHLYPLHGTLTEAVVRRDQTLVVENTALCQDYGDPPVGYRSYLGVPLRVSQGKVIGTLCSFWKVPRQFNPDEIRIAELFAERAATAIDNYNLYQSQQKSNKMLEMDLKKQSVELQLAREKLIEQERLAAIGEFTSMIVHEIRNPVTTMTMGLQFFQKLHPSGSENERAVLAIEESQRLHNLLSEVLLYAKPQVLKLVRIDITRFLRSMVPTLTEMPEGTDRELVLVMPEGSVEILGDVDKLKQVFINLVRNAYEAIGVGECVTCAVLRESGQVRIWVQNGGMPIPAELLPKLTQPFCSNKSSGSGLGLAIVKRILDAHQAGLSIESSVETGTVIQLQFPVVMVDPID